MFKIPETPNVNSKSNEIADFIEIEALINKTSVSRQDLLSSLGLLGDDFIDEREDDEDKSNLLLDEAFNELLLRKKYCGDAYPFELKYNQNVLELDIRKGNIKHETYKFLLFATRLNMKKDKTQKGIDGTLLFEEISSVSLKSYFGKDASTYIFGTSNKNSGRFKEKIDHLTKSLNEGFGCQQSTYSNFNQLKDDKLDVVAWKPFKDERGGQIIGFAQCKTGTNWESSITQLQPVSFCNRWFNKSPIHKPIKFFFLADTILKSNWIHHSSDAGIIFDRIRVVEHCSELSDEVKSRMISWNESAEEFVKNQYQ